MDWTDQVLKAAQTFGVEFDNLSLLRQALTHRSYVNESGEPGLEHNERLEYLGDAVLELVVTHYLFITFPERPEGELTAIRSALVNTNMISDAAAALKVDQYLFLSKGERMDTGRARSYILANAFEAIIGSIYLDRGYEKARTFITNNLLIHTENIINKKLWIDPKSYFQEKAQELHSVTPTYELVSEVGPDHDKKFIMAVFIGGEKVAEGEGASKQDAERAAAEAGLTTKGWR